MPETEIMPTVEILMHGGCIAIMLCISLIATVALCSSSGQLYDLKYEKKFIDRVIDDGIDSLCVWMHHHIPIAYRIYIKIHSRIERPINHIFHKYCTPNGISVERAIAVIGVWVLAEYDYNIIAVYWLAFWSFSDLLDGIRAKRTGPETKLGQFIDALCDKILYFGVIYIYRHNIVIFSADTTMIYMFIASEFGNQFIARWMQTKASGNMRANGFGKFKAFLAFTLIHIVMINDACGTNFATHCTYVMPWIGVVTFNYFLLGANIFGALGLIGKIPNKYYPRFVTYCHIICGIVACYMFTEGKYIAGAVWIALGIISDITGGKESEAWPDKREERIPHKIWKVIMGKKIYDDIGNCIDFGIAPAILIASLITQANKAHEGMSIGTGYAIGIGYAAMYLASVIKQMHRFIKEKEGDNPEGTFQGLPAPAAAGIIVFGNIAAWKIGLTGMWLTATVVITSTCMAIMIISKTKYWDIRYKIIPPKKPITTAIVVVVTFLIAINSEMSESITLTLLTGATIAYIYKYKYVQQS